MGGVTAADIATYYGTDIISGVILMGSFPYRNMLTDVATPWILSFIPSLLLDSLDAFGPTAKTFAESCVAYGDKLDQGVKYSWMGAVAGQNPNIRTWSINHTQDETALLKDKETLPYLILHGTMDHHIDGQELKTFMDANFGNFDFHIWDNVGHASFFDAPDKANPLIVNFAHQHCP